MIQEKQREVGKIENRKREIEIESTDRSGQELEGDESGIGFKERRVDEALLFDGQVFLG